jgi:SSS family solute:Na+ symporter
MQLIDWILVAGALLLVIWIGCFTQKYMRGVADFMSAGRVARRFLLAVSKGEQSAGAVVFVGAFEVINHSGLAISWWRWLPAPILLVVSIFGFVTYRYRETRVMTLGQFYEIRYSRKLRLFTGFLGFFAGLLNFGIIPVIGARAMVYFLGFSPQLHILAWDVPTYILLMAAFLAINLFVVLSGGLVTIMMTNCAEGIISQILNLVLIFGLISMFSWPQISATLADHAAGHSYLNPLDSFHVQDFNIWLVLMGLAGGIYGTMAWQNQSSYNSAPLNAHESVMGGLLGNWRGMGQATIVTLLAVCAMTYMHDPAFAHQAAAVQADVARISNPQTREQMEIPIALTHLLPSGLRGALCAILLLGILGGDSTHLHSWGSLFIQDVVMPFRRKPFAPAQHIRLLRWSIAGVAIFVFFFGIFFPLADYISMWWTVTMAIYISGAGSVIIGGLYWKKGTTAGAWAGFLTGFAASMSGIAAQQIYGRSFPLNGAHIAFLAMLISLAAYALVSLLTRREDFDMDRMLHRGIHAQPGEGADDHQEVKPKHPFQWGRIIGFDDNFTVGDKWVAGGLFAWTMAFFAIAGLGTLWYLIRPWPDSVWSTFWHYVAIIIPIVMSVITGIWFTWGGISDTIDLFRRLRQERVNPLDSGFVIDHQNLDEEVAAETARASPQRERPPIDVAS